MKETIFLNNTLQIKNNNIRKILNKDLMNQFAKEIYLSQSDILITTEGQKIRGFNAFYKYIKKLNQNGEISESLAKSFNQLIIKNSKNIGLTNREAESLSDKIKYKDVLFLKNKKDILFDIGTCYFYNQNYDQVLLLLDKAHEQEKKNKKAEKIVKSMHLKTYQNEIKRIKMFLKNKYQISNEKLHIYELLTNFSLLLSSNSKRAKPDGKQSQKEHELIRSYLENILTYFKKENINVRRFKSILIIKTSLFNTNIIHYDDHYNDFKDSWIIVNTQYLDINGLKKDIYDLESFDGNMTTISKSQFIDLLKLLESHDRQTFMNYETAEEMIYLSNKLTLIHSFINSKVLTVFNKNEIEKLDF